MRRFGMVGVAATLGLMLWSAIPLTGGAQTADAVPHNQVILNDGITVICAYPVWQGDEITTEIVDCTEPVTVANAACATEAEGETLRAECVVVLYPDGTHAVPGATY